MNEYKIGWVTVRIRKGDNEFGTPLAVEINKGGPAWYPYVGIYDEAQITPVLEKIGKITGDTEGAARNIREAPQRQG